jgi:hypothetical protein
VSTTTFPGSPRTLRGGIVVLDPETSAVLRTIVLQYNPDTLTRTLHPKSIGAEDGDRSEALRLAGPPVETITLDAEIDATDQLEHPELNPNAVALGIHPQLAALEALVYPTSAQLQANQSLAQSGTLEIAPMQAPLTILVWSKSRIIPMRITNFSITEEAFDPALNPLRAKVTLSMRVLTVDDLGFDHKGGSLFMAYQQTKERFARLSPNGAIGSLGIQGVS